MSGGLLSPSSPAFCTAKYRGGVRKDGGVRKISAVAVTKSSITFSPCRAPYAGYRTAMSGRLLSPSSPAFCTAKYRGGVRRTEGLKIPSVKVIEEG